MLQFGLRLCTVGFVLSTVSSLGATSISHSRDRLYGSSSGSSVIVVYKKDHQNVQHGGRGGAGGDNRDGHLVRPDRFHRDQREFRPRDRDYRGQKSADEYKGDGIFVKEKPSDRRVHHSHRGRDEDRDDRRDIIRDTRDPLRDAVDPSERHLGKDRYQPLDRDHQSGRDYQSYDHHEEKWEKKVISPSSVKDSSKGGASFKGDKGGDDIRGDRTRFHAPSSSHGLTPPGDSVSDDRHRDYLDNKPGAVPPQDDYRFSKPKQTGGATIGSSKTPSLLPAPGLLEGRPSCARELDICTHNHDYPIDKVQVIVDRYYNHMYDLYHAMYKTPPHEVQWVENFTHSFTHEKQHGSFVCSSEATYLRIGWAKNYKGHWMAVVNTERFPQTTRVEKCKHANKPCDYLPPCYKTGCKQREMLYPLISVNPYDPSQRPQVDLFPLPSGCVCYIDDPFYHKK